MLGGVRLVTRPWVLDNSGAAIISDWGEGYSTCGSLRALWTTQPTARGLGIGKSDIRGGEGHSPDRTLGVCVCMCRARRPVRSRARSRARVRAHVSRRASGLRPVRSRRCPASVRRDSGGPRVRAFFLHSAHFTPLPVPVQTRAPIIITSERQHTRSDSDHTHVRDGVIGSLENTTVP